MDTLGLIGFLFMVCGRGHSTLKCPYECLGRAGHYMPDERAELLADDEPIPTEDE